MPRLAVGKSPQIGWNIVTMLRDATKTWSPPVSFFLIVRETDRSEVWVESQLKPDEEQFIKHLIRDFVEGK